MEAGCVIFLFGISQGFVQVLLPKKGLRGFPQTKGLSDAYADGLQLGLVRSTEVTTSRLLGNGREGLILVETAHKPASYVLDTPMHDVLTGEVYEGLIELPPYGMLILEK